MIRNVNTKLKTNNTTHDMKNLNTPLSSARNFFTSCLCGLSSAVFASSFALFAPSASAFVLIDSDSDGLVEGVQKLDVAGDLYDVDFVFGTFDEVYKTSGGEYDFTFSSSEEVDSAFSSLFSAILGTSSEFVEPSQYSASFDSQVLGTHYMYMGFDVDEKAILGYKKPAQFLFGGIMPGYSTVTQSTIQSGNSERVLFATFSQQNTTQNTTPPPASTPEPSLILGFMTLGGLMLGSKRKTKG